MTREEAIEYLSDKIPFCKSIDEGWADIVKIEALEMALEALKRSERKKGKWKKNDNGTYSCSFCQTRIPNEQHYYANYCPYCGAQMEVEE